MNVVWLTLPIKGPLSSVTVGDYFSSKVAQLFGDCKGYPFWDNLSCYFWQYLLKLGYFLFSQRVSMPLKKKSCFILRKHLSKLLSCWSPRRSSGVRPSKLTNSSSKKSIPFSANIRKKVSKERSSWSFNSTTSLAAWPDLAKFCHLQKKSKSLANIWHLISYSAKCWAYFGKFGLIFIVANGQILKNNLTIWSHCPWVAFDRSIESEHSNIVMNFWILLKIWFDFSQKLVFTLNNAFYQ